jgi:hypothetical protein
MDRGGAAVFHGDDRTGLLARVAHRQRLSGPEHSASRARGTDHARRRDIAQRCAARANHSARGADQKKPAA